jgi:hypothetical protein
MKKYHLLRFFQPLRFMLALAMRLASSRQQCSIGISVPPPILIIHLWLRARVGGKRHRLLRPLL